MTMRRTALLVLTAGAAFALAACQDAAAEPAKPVVKTAEQVIDLSVEELIAEQAKGGIRLIDVRTHEEVAQGMIPGAEHIALDDFDPATLDLDTGRKPILYCRSGRRSADAATRLSAHLGEPVEHLAGGILAWEEAGQPVAGAQVAQ